MVQRKTNDRTQVTEVQKAFEADLYHRFIRSDGPSTPLRTAITEQVVDEDALGLTTITLGHRPQVRAELDFEFPENPQAAADFEDWLEGKIQSDVLESASRSRVVDGRHFSSDYIYQSSEQGVNHAHRELRRAGVDFDDSDSIGTILRTPVHQDILESGYIRAYDELDNITSEMSTEISRVMSDSLAEGVNPRETARRMNERTDVGLARSRRMARTETSRLYSQHSANRYSDLGVTEVEILTANPCDKCADLAAGDPYPIEEAGSLIPQETHPNCVCSLSPVVETME